MEFIDLRAQYKLLETDIQKNIQAVLEHGKFILGPEVAEFEKTFASYIGRKYCVTCANGTDALQLAYMAYGVGAGDAVFCPDVTFISSVEPAYMLGATPVFCDIEADTYNLSPESLERQILAVKKEGKLRPRAVVAVDFLGNPAKMEEIDELCKAYNLLLIEDAAQGIGAEYKGKRCGSFGTIATTSFFPAKPLGCYGDGGAVLTDDEAVAALCRSIRVHGKGPGGKYDNVRVGMNSRLDTLQAAVLKVKLHALAAYEMQQRQQVAQRYDTAFAGRFTTPYVEPGCRSNYAQYALLADSQAKRDAVRDYITNQKEIPSLVYYPTPQHALPVFQNLSCYGETFENAQMYCERTFSLPMHPYLEEGEQQRVIDAVLNFMEN